ncbi:hypothetical protein [Actinosynnema sp. NPDC023587]|uniref:hypothetical protein n=1 Tax=Actinosynnema sp. NPDC023587 TaxID=3154695 RepID=UPI0033FCCF58
MPIKVLFVLAAAAASFALAYLPPALGLDWWWTGLLVLVSAVSAVWQGCNWLLGGEAFRLVDWTVKVWWSRAYILAVGLHTVWIACAAVEGWWWLPALAGLALAELATAIIWQFNITQVRIARPPGEIEKKVFDGELVDDLPDYRDDWELDDVLGAAVLAGVGHSHYQVVQTEELPDGAGVSWECLRESQLAVARRALRQAQVQAKAAGEDWRAVAMPKIEALPALTRKNAEDIGLAVQELLGVPVPRSGVDVTEDGQMGRVTITVTWTKPASKALPFRVLDGSRLDPRAVPVGRDRRAHEVTADLCQHIKIVGATGSGKTALERIIILAGILVGKVVVCGAAKVEDLVADIVDIDDGTGSPVELPIRVAQGMDDTLKMLVAMLGEATRREHLPADERRALTPIWIVVTESTRVLTDHSRVIRWQGRDWTAGQIVGHLTRSTLFVQVYVVLSGQDFLVEFWGAEGGSIFNNTTLTAMCRSGNADERRRALGDRFYGLPDLPEPGETYLADRGEPRYVQLYYPQESAKPVLHDGPTIAQIARAHTLQPRARWTPDELAATGTWFASLPTRDSGEFRAYLQGRSRQADPPAPGTDGPRSEHADLLAAAGDMVAAALARTAIPLPAADADRAPEPAPVPEPEVTAAVQRPPLTDRVVALVTAAGRMGRREILAALLAEGYETSQQSVDNLLGRLVDVRQVLVRPPGTKGVYTPAHTPARALTSRSPSPV